MRVRMKMNNDELRQYFMEQVFIYYNDVYRIIFNVVKHHHNAEDMTQIVMVKAWGSFESLREPDKSKAWIKAITRNVLREYMRKKKMYICRSDRKFFSELEKLELKTIEIDILETIEKKERIGIVFRGLDLLDERYSDIIWMHIIGDLGHKEIAGIKRMKHGTVRAYYSRGMGMLQNICNKLENGELN